MNLALLIVVVNYVEAIAQRPSYLRSIAFFLFFVQKAINAIKAKCVYNIIRCHTTQQHNYPAMTTDAAAAATADWLTDSQSTLS